MKEAHRYLAGVYSALGDKQRAAAELETYLRLTGEPNLGPADDSQNKKRSRTGD